MVGLEQGWICPEGPNEEGTHAGCGHGFNAEPDEEGWVECPECGLNFNREGEGLGA